jgi:Zn-dependent M28 family amino/carboxypeptidase
VLSVARAVAPMMAQARHGLRVCLFTAEEWGLSGSREWLARMTPEARALFVLDLNVDTVGADPHLTALTSGFAGLEAFVRTASEASGQHVAIHAPPMPNSDHANFAAHGIPALRLVAGFDRPQSEVRHILTAQDTRDKVAPGDLERAALFTARMVWAALCASGPVVASWR